MMHRTLTLYRTLAAVPLVGNLLAGQFTVQPAPGPTVKLTVPINGLYTDTVAGEFTGDLDRDFAVRAGNTVVVMIRPGLYQA